MERERCQWYPVCNTARAIPPPLQHPAWWKYVTNHPNSHMTLSPSSNVLTHWQIQRLQCWIWEKRWKYVRVSFPLSDRTGHIQGGEATKEKGRVRRRTVGNSDGSGGLRSHSIRQHNFSQYFLITLFNSTFVKYLKLTRKYADLHLSRRWPPSSLGLQKMHGGRVGTGSRPTTELGSVFTYTCIWQHIAHCSRVVVSTCCLGSHSLVTARKFLFSLGFSTDRALSSTWLVSPPALSNTNSH